MKSEQFAKAQELQKELSALNSHLAEIEKADQEAKYDYTEMAYDRRGYRDKILLLDEFFNQEEFMALYRLRLEHKISQLQYEFNNL